MECSGSDAAQTQHRQLPQHRLLGIALEAVHANAPISKIILVRGPEDVVPAIERVLGKSLLA